jgi:hypothetical protein
MGRKLQTLLPIAPKQLKPKLPNFRSLRENEKESKIKQKRNYDRRHRARLLTKDKTNDKVWITDQKKSGTDAIMYYTNEIADVVCKFNVSGGFEILPDLVT